jgi:hypothetical protein
VEFSEFLRSESGAEIRVARLKQAVGFGFDVFRELMIARLAALT